MTILETELNKQRISAVIPIDYFTQYPTQWNSTRNESPIFYWCTRHI